ncbi:MAG: hypothetical protein M1837_001959 [Sclerophora amabilis]|nr:MAG: hypothetical protein M1837_001959 [Sclerophora amabilis]
MDVDFEAAAPLDSSNAASEEVVVNATPEQLPELPPSPEDALSEDASPSGKTDTGPSNGGDNVVVSSAFHRLPREIISQILYHADSNLFASLVLLSRDWRRTGQSAQLYAHHLSRCPSYSASSNTPPIPSDNNCLLRLQRRFQSEVKRNLFEAYLRPKETAIELLSHTTSSSVTFPGGEAFHFSFSQNGQCLLAFNSSRIYILDLTARVVAVRRELKIPRRPASVAIDDDACTLAVLSTDHQVNIYDLKRAPAHHSRSLPLDNAPRTIALSPCGSVLAAAYAGGVEVYSLASETLSNAPRAVRCDAVDSLSFSSDGALLLGTTLHSSPPSTVILSAPYYNEGQYDTPTAEVRGQMWTTQILFPNSSRACSHSTLLPTAVDEDANWIFTHDQLCQISRAVRVDDLKFGARFFSKINGDRQAERSPPSTLPAANSAGEMVAAGFAGKEIWLFGIPENLDERPHPSQVGFQTATSILTSTATNEEDEGPSTFDGYQNPTQKGRHIADFDGLSALKWVSRDTNTNMGYSGERLVAVAPGGVTGVSDGEEGKVMPFDGSRITLFDFHWGPGDGEKSQITIEIGDDDAELLKEENQDLEAEVAVVRRRTIAQRPLSMGFPRPQSPATHMSMNFDDPATEDSRDRNRSTASAANSASTDLVRSSRAVGSIAEHDISFEEAQDALDAPYSHTQPRSRSTMYRSATAVAANRRSNASTLIASGRVEYRRAGGPGEVPDESDADNWVPPPPPYAPSADRPLPNHLQLTLQPRSTEPIRRTTIMVSPPSRAHTTLEGLSQSALQRTMSTMERAGNTLRAARPSMRRRRSESGASAAESATAHQFVPGATFIPFGPQSDEDDLYAASIPQSPLERAGPSSRPVSAEFRSSINPPRLSFGGDGASVSAFEPRPRNDDLTPSGSEFTPRNPSIYTSTDISTGVPAGDPSRRSQQNRNAERASQHDWSSEPFRPSFASHPPPSSRMVPGPSHLEMTNYRLSPPLDQTGSPRRGSTELTGEHLRTPDFISAQAGSSPERPNGAPGLSPTPLNGRQPQVMRPMSAYAENAMLARLHSSPSHRLETMPSDLSRVGSTRSRSKDPSTQISLRRRLSRAERSAAINIKQAKRHGWGGQSKKGGKAKGKGKARSRGWGDASEGWTDVSAGSATDEPRDKKCNLM